jgi:hypothetical protein
LDFGLTHFRFITKPLDKSDSKVIGRKRPQCHGSDGKKEEPIRKKGKKANSDRTERGKSERKHKIMNCALV